jgi:hypothetical protein
MLELSPGPAPEMEPDTPITMSDVTRIFWKAIAWSIASGLLVAFGLGWKISEAAGEAREVKQGLRVLEERTAPIMDLQRDMDSLRIEMRHMGANMNDLKAALNAALDRNPTYRSRPGPR